MFTKDIKEYSNIGSNEECKNYCANDPLCNAYTYRTNSYCYLNHPTPDNDLYLIYDQTAVTELSTDVVFKSKITTRHLVSIKIMH